MKNFCLEPEKNHFENGMFYTCFCFFFDVDRSAAKIADPIGMNDDSFFSGMVADVPFYTLLFQK